MHHKPYFIKQFKASSLAPLQSDPPIGFDYRGGVLLDLPTIIRCSAHFRIIIAETLVLLPPLLIYLLRAITFLFGQYSSRVVQVQRVCRCNPTSF